MKIVITIIVFSVLFFSCRKEDRPNIQPVNKIMIGYIIEVNATGDSTKSETVEVK